MEVSENPRRDRGLVIANLPNQIARIDNENYRVKSQSGNGEYEIHLADFGWVCSCPDHIYRHVKCKHIWAVDFSTQLRREVEARKIQPIINATNCVYCSSLEIARAGVRRNKHGDIQKWQCKTCGRYFSFNIGFEKMKHNPQAIT
ncbi:SWIM zinc finger family protein, partial [Candidatus Bathyarchaeota archaeon]|nr:SWIM zinc finger family protein [Candidatus Bathyarchaeota archaeon]